MARMCVLAGRAFRVLIFLHTENILTAVMPAWSNIAFIVAAYLIGGLSPGYWLARKRGGVDIREIGSGATGATNAGRVLGKRGFYTVVLIDILKGFLVALAASYFMADSPPAWRCAAAYAVVAGHIWPVWLGFRGGKGVATFYGAWCPLAGGQGFIPAAICIVLALALKPVFRRSFSVSWLVTHALFPVIAWWLWRDPASTLICAAMILTLWISHRANILAVLGKKA
ncbi:glycerol-3-phosphate acyltransferase PlsY [Ereboglobus sp. PH5-10]|nr:glycerol-3-phosphate acyltransferase PlsY [Ereboglobus sp. PH5-10]